MEVVIAKHSGFCSGVKRAVDTAKSYAGKNACVLGELIHNQTVLDELEKLGIKTVQRVEEADCEVLIIRSHGAPLEVYEKAKEKGITVVDCTCAFVKKIHDIVSEYFQKGYHVVIAGEPSHPEVQGINSRANNSATILRDDNDDFDLNPYEKVCVVAQTTFSTQKFDKILKNISNYRDKTVEIFQTICYTTRDRQTEAETLSAASDAMIVIGGANSSNTAKLSEICQRHCKHVFWINNPNELDYQKINKFIKVGIVSGASTPNEQSQEVFSNMEFNTEAKSSEMEEALKQMPEKQRKFRKGDKITAVISSATEDGLALSINTKTEILLAKEEMIDEAYDKANYESKVGEEIEVVIMEVQPKVVVSEKAIQKIKEEEALLNEVKDGKIFTVVCDGHNKGGLTAKYGSYSVFVPASQIRMGYVSDLEKYVGKTLRLRADKIEDEKRKQIVASQRVILEEERAERDRVRAEKEDAFFNAIQVGDVVEGEVVRFAQFGAFVQVCGFDCLAHISDLAWAGVKTPADVLEIGKTYQFKVLKIDRESKKVSIGYKQLQPKPWQLAADKYAVGDTVIGKVVRLVAFGAFVEVEKGIDGLVHVSQISHDWLENPTSALKIGEEIEAKILDLDVEKEKMTLSIKALLPEPEVKKTNPNKPQRKEAEEGEVEARPRRAKTERKPKEDDEIRGWSEGGLDGISIADMLGNK